MRRCKVVHLITGLGAGGAEGMLYRLVTRMDRSQFENVVISLSDEGDIGRKLASDGIEVHALSLNASLSGLARGTGLVPLLRSLKPDVLQTWMYHADFLGLVAGRFAMIPSILWNIRCANVELRHYPFVSRALLRILPGVSGLPQRIVINSQAGRLHHERLGYRPRKWELIANGVDTEAFDVNPQTRQDVRRMLGIPQDAVVIGMVARRDVMKDHSTLMEAAAILRTRCGGAHVVLVGRGLNAEDPDLSAPNVHVVGERTDVAAVMSSFDVATLSSIGEGFPNVIAEAMACGVPCVATDVGDSRWIIGDTGRVVPPRDPEALADGWLEMIAIGSEARRALGQRARARAVREFAIDRAVGRYEALYREVADERRH
jgi:glycosyltransferase involved in cell wall biosynthesis